MSRRILSVGQCMPDQSTLNHYIQSNFDVQIDSVDLAAEVAPAIDRTQYDLVLVNRVLDRDGDDGLRIIKSLASKPDDQRIPVMLVSNYEHFQEQAVDLGALPGFGKAELHLESVRERLAAALDVSFGD